MDCHKESKFLNEAAKIEFEQESIRAVGKIFGYPAQQKTINNAKGARKIALINQKKLFETILSDIKLLGSIKNFQFINPHETVDALAKHLYYKNNRTIITPESILSSPRRAKALLVAVNKIRNARIKYYKEYMANPSIENLRTKLEKAVMPPHLILVKWDKYGIASKVVEKARLLSSESIQNYSKYWTHIESEYDRLTGYIKSIVSRLKIKDILGGMDGIQWEDQVKNKSITIWERKSETNQYIISYNDDKTKEKILVNGEDIGITEKIFNDKMIEFASSVFTSEVMNGQMRYIVPKAITAQNVNSDEVKIVKDIATGKRFGVERKISIKGDVYSYIMIKQKEGISGSEVYNAYLIRVKKSDGTSTGLMLGYDSETLKNYKNIIKEGWYRSNKTMEFKAKNGHVSKFINFQYLKTQPSELLFSGVYGRDGSTISIWNYILRLRKVFAIISRDISDFAIENEQLINKLRKAITKRYGEESADTIINDILDSMNVESRVWVDSYGKTRTSNSLFTLLSKNFFPNMYTREQNHIQLDNAIKEVEIRAKKYLEDGNQSAYESEIETLESLRTLANYEIDRFNGRNNKKDLVEARRVLTTKRRRVFTDRTKIRKDNAVIKEYISETFRILTENSFVTNAIADIYRMQQLKYPEAVIEYTINKVKQATGSPNIDASLGSYESFANFLNKLPKFIRRGRVFNAESAKKLVIRLSGLSVMRFLGIDSAIINNTQPVNNFITRGYKLYFDALKIRNSSMWENRFKKAVDMSGVTNVISMFETFILSDETPKFRDAGFIGPIPNILNLKAWTKMMKMDRESFSKYGDPQVDKFLMKVQSRFSGAKGKDIAYMRRILHEIATDDSTDKKLLEARFKNLVGEVSDSMLKKMVSWKLSYLPEFLKPFESGLSFTKAEERMREVAAIVDILHAQKEGILPEIMEDGSDPIYSDIAIRIMRDASNSTMFGMSPVFQGMAFDGFGKLFFQFKTYALNQILFDYNTLESFWNGGSSSIDSAIRLSKAVKDIVLGKDSRDEEAKAVIRFIFTRFMASVFSVALGTIPLINAIARRSGIIGNVVSKVRGAENPMFGLPIRLVVWSLLMAMGYSDDDKKKDKMLKQFGDGLLMLTIPAIIGWIIRDIGDAYRFFAD